MRGLKKCLVAGGLAGLLSTAGAVPVALTIDGVWFEFAVGDLGDTWRSPLDGTPIAFELTSASDFTLRVVDIGFAGDRVDVLVNGTVALGPTSDVPVDDTVYAFTPDEALAAPGTWSRGIWSLAAGSYTFTGTAVASPFGGATWAISAQPVPEPGSFAMMLGGLTLAAAAVRRRRG